MVDAHENMSHMMRCDCFVGSQTFDSSHVQFRVHVWVHIVSRDTIECGMTWKSIQLHLYGIHVHMGLTFTCDSLNHGFT